MSLSTFGEVPLLGAEGAPCSGTAFGLDRPARESTVVTTEGWAVETRRGKEFVVARGGSDAGYEPTFSNGLLHAQKGLDLLSIRGGGDLQIKRFDDDHMAWWQEPEGLVIRIVSLQSTLRIDVPPVEATVTAPDGSVTPPQPEPKVEWHESFRYMRLSQTSDDLFDAYRNAYLALESLLSSIDPQKVKPSGGPGEGEREWFHRALLKANTIVPLSTCVPAGTANPLQYLIDELYEKMRTAIFHAKSGRRTLLPQNEAERHTVTDTLKLLVRLYLRLAHAHLGARRAGGGMYATGFRMITGPLMGSMRLYASDDETPFRRTDKVANPAGGTLVELTQVSPIDNATAFLTTKLASASTVDLSGLPFVRRVVGINPDGAPVMAAVLEARLSLGSAARFEALLGVRGENIRQPRTRYSF